MNFAKRNRDADGDCPSRLRGALAGVVAALLLAASGTALAQAMYRWTDAQGRVSYGDKPPKGALNVTRIEVPPATNTVPATAPARPAAVDAPAAPAPDIATKRRALRNQFEANLAQAREKLDLARKNLAEGTDPQDDERQMIQRGAPGPSGVAKMNCRQVAGKDGKTATVCPSMVPNDAFYQRIARLEDAVRAAEEEVAAAENAYRRGVD
jgi:hypothetical protein